MINIEGTKVLLRPDKKEERTDSGLLIIPETVQDKLALAKMAATFVHMGPLADLAFTNRNISDKKRNGIEKEIKSLKRKKDGLLSSQRGERYKIEDKIEELNKTLLVEPKEGTRLMIVRYSGQDYEDDGEVFWVIQDKDVLGILT